MWVSPLGTVSYSTVTTVPQKCKKNKKKLPERLEELNKLNEAHRAVWNHQILEAFETAFTSSVPRPAAPCPATHREKAKYLKLNEKGRF